MSDIQLKKQKAVDYLAKAKEADKATIRETLRMFSNGDGTAVVRTPNGGELRR